MERIPNRRKPDKMQWLLVWLMGLVAAGMGYQIVANEQNAVTRAQVQELVERQKNVPQQWQIDQINSRLDQIQNVIASKVPKAK